MIPVYIFYSMFGFQRTGDQFWAAADQMTRGFLLGATAGRTTLNGEGLQHEDGHSLLLASTNPACVAYDPAFAFEIGHIVARRAAPDVRRPRPAKTERLLLPHALQRADPPAGRAARTSTSTASSRNAPLLPRAAGEGPTVQILAVRHRDALGPGAQRLLHDDWGVRADVWSVTSWTQLRRDALATDDVEPPSRPASPDALRHQAAGKSSGPGVRRLGLDARRARPDRPMGPRHLGLAGNGRLRALRHPLRAAPSLRNRRAIRRRRALQQLARQRSRLDSSVVDEAQRTYHLDTHRHDPQQ